MRWTFRLSQLLMKYISISNKILQIDVECFRSRSIQIVFLPGSAHWQPAIKLRNNSYIFWSQQQPFETYEWYTVLDRVLKTKKYPYKPMNLWNVHSSAGGNAHFMLTPHHHNGIIISQWTVINERQDLFQYTELSLHFLRADNYYT